MTDADDLDLLAGEYVLGTLTAQERAAFAARLRDDPDAARAVAAWERRLAALALLADPVAPAPEVWERIERALPRDGRRPVPFRVIEGSRRDERGEGAQAWRRARDRWRLATLAAGGIAAALLAFIAVREVNLRRAPDETYLAVVNRGGAKPALLVRVDVATRQVTVRPVDAEAPAGRSLELWYIGADAAPRSLGVLRSAPATLSAPEGTTPGAAGTFAVSVEPEGGSTAGKPTGPVIYSGQLVRE